MYDLIKFNPDDILLFSIGEDIDIDTYKDIIENLKHLLHTENIMIYPENMIKNTLDWLDTHQDATKEEYEAKQKELESKVQPIFAKMYQQGQQGGMPNMTQQQYQQK